MPDENGLDLIPELVDETRVNVVMSAQTTLMTAVKATERGAFDYLPKPFDIKNLISIVKRGLKLKWDKYPNEKEAAEDALPLIGRSPAMQEVYRTVFDVDRPNHHGQWRIRQAKNW